MLQESLLLPDWPAPNRVRAYSTTRCGGVSMAPFKSLNLGDHVGDDPAAVAANRQHLCEALQLPSKPFWLRQVHGTVVYQLTDMDEGGIEADGSFTRQLNRVCVVMTADCLPLLLCDREGSVVAAVHAGWRGLYAGIIEQAVTQLGVSPSRLMAWLGPAIGAQAFEVGSEVREAFLQHDVAANEAFIQKDSDHWLADLYLLARQRLRQSGVQAIYGGEFCTYYDPQKFFSYRRDVQTGRMATLIYLKE